MSRGPLLLTRAAEQDSVAMFAAHGWQVTHVPCIRVADPADPAALDRALATLDYDWLVLTSQNAVARVRARTADLGGAKIAVVGAETARALHEHFGRAPDCVPRVARGEALADELDATLAPGSRLLWLRAAEARDVLPEQLRVRGHHLDVVIAYRVEPALEHASALAAWLTRHRHERAIVVFASSRTAHSFFHLVEDEQIVEMIHEFRYACISPITASALATHGVHAHFVAREHTVRGLLDTLRAEA